MTFVLVAVVLGLVAGVGARWLLANLRRGAVIRGGPLEIATGAVSGVGAFVSQQSGSGLIPLVLWTGLLGVTLSAVDIKHHRLPDAITLPAIAITAALLLLTQRWFYQSGDSLRAGAAGLVLGGLFLGLAYAAPRGMGRGDAKLAVTIGLLLGYVSWAAVPLGVALAFVIGAVVGIVGIAAGRIGLKSAIPFGPSLLTGCWVVLLLGR